MIIYFLCTSSSNITYNRLCCCFLSCHKSKGKQDKKSRGGRLHEYLSWFFRVKQSGRAFFFSFVIYLTILKVTHVSALKNCSWHLPYEMLGIKLKLVICKASTLPAITLALAPRVLIVCLLQFITLSHLFLLVPMKIL